MTLHKRSINTQVQDNKSLKQAIWLYFILLIFEGALRKWFLPFLATPLLIVRDPIALWAVLIAWRRGLLPATPYLSFMFGVGFLSIFTAIVLGHGNPAVALYGARVFLIHFPFIFVMARVLNKDDVILIGKTILFIAIPMAILLGLQFYSPQSAWVNRGVGGDIEGAGFSGALGYSRPPGTFSFTSGNAAFFALVGSFVFYFWLHPKKINKIILIGATTALLAAIPFSISRGLFFNQILAIIFAALATLRKPKNLGGLFFVVVAIVVGVALLSQTEFFQKSTEAFTDRLTNANEQEGGLEGVLLDRYLGGMVGALTTTEGIPFFGVGVGLGTNVGSMLTTGTTQFLVAEGEWGRVIGELGPLMGLAVIFLRLGLGLKIALQSYRKLVMDELLPWMLLSYGLLTIPQGGWAQPTSLGFCTLVAGLIMASFNPGTAKKGSNPNTNNSKQRKRKGVQYSSSPSEALASATS